MLKTSSLNQYDTILENTQINLFSEREKQIIDSLNIVFKNILDVFIHPLIRSLVGREAYFAGGCIRSFLENTQINDYDVYFTNPEAANKFKEFLLLGLNTNNGFLHRDRIKILHQSDNAITCEIKHEFGSTVCRPVQFIIKYSGSPVQLIENFDFSSCKGYFIPQSPYLEDSKCNHLFIHPSMAKAIKSKYLHFNPKCWNPLNSMKRMVKFVKAGYSINQTQLHAMATAIRNASQEQIDAFKRGDTY